MTNSNTILDNEELQILKEIENGDWHEIPLSDEEIEAYKNHAAYTLSLKEKKRHQLIFQ